MARERNIPLRDIAGSDKLKAAYEQAIKDQPLESKFRKAASEVDPASITALKDLNNVVKDQKKYINDSNKTLNKLDKTIDKVNQTMSTTMQVLTETLGIQRNIMSELQKLNKITKKEDEELLETLKSIDRHIGNKSGAAAEESSKGILEGLTTSIGSLTRVLGPLAGVLATAFAANEAYDIFNKIPDAKKVAPGQSGLAPEWMEQAAADIDRNQDILAAHRGERSEGKDASKSFKNVFSGYTNPNEVSQSVREARDKAEGKNATPIGQQRYHGQEFTEEQRKKYNIPDNYNTQGDESTGSGQFSSGGEVPKSGWWTSERQKQAVDYLIKNGNFTPYGAAAAVARMTKEAPKGPGDSNNIGGGHWGIAQWGINRRGREMAGASFEEQLAWYVKETMTTEKAAGDRFRSAKSAQEGAYAAASFERAEGWKESGGKTDVLMNSTPIDAVYKNAFAGGAPDASKQQTQTQTAAKMPTSPSEGTPAGTHWKKWGDKDALYDDKTKAEVSQIKGTARYDEILNSIGGQNKQAGEKQGGEKAYSGKSLDGINNALASAFQQAAAEYKQKTGKTVNVTSGLRSTSDQQVLWDKKQRGEIRYPVARPGTSLHEKGLAIDVDSSDASKMDSMGILSKYGLARPVQRDPVHIQLAGTRMNEAAGPTMQESARTTTGTGISGEVSAAPVSQPSMTPSMGGMGSMGGMSGIMGMLGGMGGMGGLGGIMGMASPILDMIGGGLSELFGVSQAQAAPSRPASMLEMMPQATAAVGQSQTQPSAQMAQNSAYNRGMPLDNNGIGNDPGYAGLPPTFRDLLDHVFGKSSPGMPQLHR